MARPQVNQIYTLVNEIFSQMTGRSDIKAVDTASLVSMGKDINNLGLNDIWLNTLCRRIGYTIDGYRAYRNMFADLYRTQVEWGAIVQKLTVEMPDALEDKMPDVGQMDGQSLDHYIINNPKARQKIFDKETPYSFFITMQTKYLREAFLSEHAMSAFIAQIFGKVQNKIEVVLEDLGRLAINNYMLNADDKQVFNLVTIYNGIADPATPLTAQTALFDEKFLAWATGFINNILVKMRSMSVLFNAEGYQRFTPDADRKLYMLSDFSTQIATTVQYKAFNDAKVDVSGATLVPYWQATKDTTGANEFATLSKIMGTDKTLTNVVAFACDREAVGTFRQEEQVLTTPVNARGAYYNTFWHENQLWFNDLSENGVIFTLN